MIDRFSPALRRSLRSLSHRPGYSILVVAILAVVIGAGTAILAVVDSVLLQALPYPQPDRLLLIWDQHHERGIERMNVSMPKLVDWQQQTRSFDTIGAASGLVNLILAGRPEPLRLSTTLVTPELLRLTGARPILGRLFTETENRTPGEPRVVLLSHGLWQREFGGDEDIIGKQLALSGLSYEVVGVMPDDFVDFPFPAQQTDLWVPATMASQIYGVDMLGLRTSRIFVALARLGEGKSVEDAQAELETLTAGLQVAYPDSEGGWTQTIEPLRQSFVGTYEPALLGLAAGAVLLLLIGCANVTSLLLVRASRRQQELATLMALGASRLQVFRQSLAESLLLASAGGTLGVVVAMTSLKSLAGLVPVDWPRYIRIEARPVILLVAALVTVSIALVTAALSILPCLRQGAGIVLASRGAVEGSGGALSQSLVIAEVAVAVMLMVGAGLMMQSFSHLRSADVGFDPEGLLALQIEAPPEIYEGDRLGLLARELEDALEAIPGITAGHIWSPQVPGQSSWYTAVRPRSRPELRDEELPLVRFHYVGPGALEGIGLRFVAGRGIAEEDRADGQGAIVLSESAARALWPDGDEAIGQQVRRWNRDRWLKVVGITEDAKQSGRQGPGTDDNLDVYFSFMQEPQSQIVLLARSNGDVDQALSSARDTVKAVAPALPAFDLDTLATRMAEQEAIPRFTATLTVFFALTALFLASIGLYGLLAYTVSLRTREIGLRVALGAQPTRVLRQVVSSGLRLVVVGLAVGLGLALVLNRWLDSLLFEVSPSDPLTFVSVATLLLMVATSASLLPATSALRIDPHEALRSD